MRGVFLFSAIFSIFALVVITIFLLASGIPFIAETGFGKFVLGTEWSPMEDNPVFGIFPMIVASIYTTALSVAFGITLGLATAIALYKFCPAKLVGPIRQMINLLSGIPSVIFGLLDDMLKISQLENSTSLPDNETMVDCSTTVQEIFAELSSQINDKNITAKVQGDAHIFADPKQIYEQLSNLITNAIHYNKTGGDILVDLSENEDFSTIVVQDTGIGIPKESLPRLCERFYRVDKSHSKKTGGTGLGLAIVKHICIQYNATLDIESTLDVGSTFSITFPKK